VVFAVTKLKQSVLCHSPVATAAGAIQANQLTFQVVDTQQTFGHIALEVLPILVVTQEVQHNCQPVVTKIFSPDAGLQGRCCMNDKTW
jgi:hypothetical protein